MFANDSTQGTLSSSGAIDSLGAVYITGNGNVSFIKDSSGEYGGAITASSEIVIADNSGDVVFAGNTLSGGNSNALTQDGLFTSVNNQLAANSGKSIIFYDGNEFSDNLVINGYTSASGSGSNQ